jgi:hypothetical protein
MSRWFSGRFGGRLRPGSGRLRGWWLFVVCVTLGVLAVSVASAGGATTAVSSFTKTGVDKTTGSTAATERRGETAPGNTLRWVLSYRNMTGGDASVSITDRIGGTRPLSRGRCVLRRTSRVSSRPTGARVISGPSRRRGWTQ